MSPEQRPTSHVRLEFQFGDDEASIEFPAEGLTTSCPVTGVGRGLYRLEGLPIGSGAAVYKDVIEAEDLAGGKLRFRRVAVAGGWRVYDYVLRR